MNHSPIAELTRKNRDLRLLVTRLSAIILRNAAEQRQVAAQEARLVMTPVERMTRLRELTMHSGELREISLQVMQIGLTCRQADAANALKRLAGEFGEEAGRVDALIATAPG